MDGSSQVPALARAMRIVDLLAETGQPGLTVTEIAAATGIAKSTTALLCGALEQEGLARRHENRFTLGRRFLTLAGDYLATVDQLGDFYEEVRRQPIMSRQSARLALLDGTDVIYLARYEAGRSRRFTGAVGDRFPASVTATGKAILSTLPDRTVEDRFRGKVFPRFTERSIQSLPELLHDLAQVRERGYAIDDEETNLGQVCFALPVVDASGEPAQLSVSSTMAASTVATINAQDVIGELQQVAQIFQNPLAGKSF